MTKRRHLRVFDLRQLGEHAELIGVDEAGRGALAGPVVAGAVRLTRTFLESRWALQNAGRVNDSKQLTAEERATLHSEILALAAGGQLQGTTGRAEVAEIEQHNILGATKLAMRRALEAIYPPAYFLTAPREPDLFSSPAEIALYRPPSSCRILVDGLPLKPFPYPHTGIVGGDGRSLAIALASILAKVTRDALMTALDREVPGYGFARHKGYGTEDHREAVLKLGRSPHHREMFLRKLMATRRDPAQVELFQD